MSMVGETPVLPPGFRFHPTDEELVTYYLVKKVLDRSFTGRVIAEVDLNKCEPWNLPRKYPSLLSSGPASPRVVPRMEDFGGAGCVGVFVPWESGMVVV